VTGLVIARDVKKARGVKAKASKPRSRPETCKTKAKATDPRPRLRM